LTYIRYPDKGKVNLVFDKFKHRYRIKDEFVPSVTRIIDSIIPKPHLIPWAAKMGADWWLENSSDDIEMQEILYDGIKNAHKIKSQTALKTGSMVHDYIEKVIKWSLNGASSEPIKPEHDAALNSINAFGEWVKSNEVKWISSEEKIYSRTHNYAGTVDAIAEINDEFCVIDFKTSAQIYKEYYLQIAAYKHAIEEVYGRDVECCWILRFDKESGKFQAKEIREDYFPVFEMGLNFQKAYSTMRKRK
tara:strand:+ start:566 stop:1306 length:741 start_codon:yes stop_codon:yes gene_type:complete